MTLLRKAPARPPKILECRPLVPDDLRVLAQPRPPSGTIRFLREKHHRIARLDAAGLPAWQICSITGIAYQTLYRYRQDPAYSELVAVLRRDLNAAAVASNPDLTLVENFKTESVTNLMTMESMVTEQLAEAQETGEKIPMNTLFKGISERSDRFGFGKHTTSTNVHVNFGTEIEQARERLSRVRTIEASTLPAASTPPAMGSGPPQEAIFRRRGL